VGEVCVEAGAEPVVADTWIQAGRGARRRSSCALPSQGVGRVSFPIPILALGCRMPDCDVLGSRLSLHHVRICKFNGDATGDRGQAHTQVRVRRRGEGLANRNLDARGA
jgi:hypothetical protein